MATLEATSEKRVWWIRQVTTPANPVRQRLLVLVPYRSWLGCSVSGRSPGAFRDESPYSRPAPQQYRSNVNVPSATSRTVETGAEPGRAQAQEHVFTLLRGVQREFRRQYVQLAGDHGLPFPVAGPCLAMLQEICEHPGATVNEVARMTGLPKSRVSVLISGLAAQRIVRKDSDSRDSRLVRLCITAEGSERIAEWTALAQQAMGHLLQPLADEELEVVAEGLAALQRAFQLAKMPSRAEQHPTKGLPC